MRPKRAEHGEPDDLFRARLSQQLDLGHPLVRLAGLIDWEGLESAFGPLYHERAGRPGKPTRLMVGLTYLKHTYNLSDEAVCVIDPEGDYGVLGQLPRARVIPVSLEEHWADVLDALRVSSPVVADLSAAPHSAQVTLAASGLARLRRAASVPRRHPWGIRAW